MDRRKFLKATGATFVGTAALKAEQALGGPSKSGHHSFPGDPDRLGVLVDTTLCIGKNCRRCEFACAKQHGLPPPPNVPEDESVFDERRRPTDTAFTVVNRFENPKANAEPIYVKRQCMHCDEPACASACLVSAFTKTPEGPVVYNPDLCIGCRYCMIACPFDVPAYEYSEPLSPRIMKCSMCFEERIQEGKAPACVSDCPKEVMTFGKRKDLIRIAHEKIAQNPDRYVEHLYGEHEVGGTSWMYLAGVPFDQLGFRTDLGETPYPELTRGFLSSVPLVLTLWPVLFSGVYIFSKRRQEIAKEEANAKDLSKESQS